MQLTMNLSEGQRLKSLGQQTLDAKNELFLATMRYFARQHSHKYGHVTIDEVRAYAVVIGRCPTHHNAWGCIFNQKGWTVVGRQPSKLVGNRGREIKMWRWEGV